MTIKIEVDVTSTPPGQLIKLAKYMLECAGYVEQVATPGPVAAPAFDGAMVKGVGTVSAAGYTGWPPAPVTTIDADEKEAVSDAMSHITDSLNSRFADAVATDVLGPDLTQTAQQAPGIEVDSAGMPWDHRIHASSRAKVADGTWRQRRNLDPNVLAQVQAEMLQVMGLPTPTTTATVTTSAIPSAPPVSVPVPPPFVPSVVEPAAPVAIAPPPLSTPAGVVTTASRSEGTPVTFPQWVPRLTKMLAAKDLHQADIAAACNSLGIPHMPALASRPDLVPSMATALGIAL